MERTLMQHAVNFTGTISENQIERREYTMANMNFTVTHVQFHAKTDIW